LLSATSDRRSGFSQTTLSVISQGADDPEGIFAEPVAEAYPEIAKEYKKVIKKPMDFRTILEDRLPWYQTADGLRDDLMLVFNNCITFNGDDSGYSMLAT
jgi:hypothetical protein